MERITRRSFSKISAGAAVAMAGIKSSSAAIRTSSISPNDRLTVGLIGAGGMGMGDLRDMLRIPEVDCLALADVDLRRVEKNRTAVEELRGKKPEGYQDFRRIIERKDIDMVIVGTPDHWHALPTVLACQEGKDVYCEKPLATSIAEGRVMVRAAEKYGRIV
ncbi:MAG: Gfo/Idh/MocA family oxidoreductase [Acidobacteriota bacterium]